MGDDLRDIIAQLKLERSILRDGGYGPSVQTPAKVEQLFRDSITCLNAGETVRRHPCSDCLLWEFVPNEHLGEGIPCHHIPLNERGDTIATLEAKGDRDSAEQALLAWLDRTILQLEDKLSRRNMRPSA
jgi:hypothetical protein